GACGGVVVAASDCPATGQKHAVTDRVQVARASRNLWPSVKRTTPLLTLYFPRLNFADWDAEPLQLDFGRAPPSCEIPWQTNPVYPRTIRAYGRAADRAPRHVQRLVALSA